ncbi:vitamin B12 transport ATP-binding protein BacA [Variibacter gotjawalensis]|uniref:Vitamin B12 transport ATP-binding protein BacA n=1 Tax=Variibacter gotjawalensis TaxID=1333996 RepID=A0A0S3PS80_9BRAD|nr:ABC transporter ATP-binding protein/permease [Variibacter gotjawalensis]NIK49115.1 putative ATP-binding cassette transporter [Variibacter gotjawalensis]RZS50971.1 putative ATP-binding cassette transporter [Variibacter gotjawalensis]BAT58805.1 vitamin B12 transport ATP-binding protein BacA [Variibacter gotjawalensis]
MDVRSAAGDLDEAAKQKSQARLFWRSGRGFWRETQVAWWLTGGIVLFVLVQLWFQYKLNLWNRSIFDALEKKDGGAVWSLALSFGPLALGSIVTAIIIVYVRMRMQRRWRGWLTQNITNRWLNGGRYFQLNFMPGDHENPEHRLTEDMRVATEAPVDFATGILTAFLTATTFIGVLYFVGGSLEFDWGGSKVTIPAFLVIAVVAYCAIVSGSMTIIARSFVPVAAAKNQSEAEFRYALTRVRENGESIAILGGEEEEKAGLNKLLSRVVVAWQKMAAQYMRTTGVSHANFIIASVIPVILCSPKYLAGTMSLGEVMQAAAAFIQVQYAFNWIVDNYPKLAEWTASARRVGSLVQSLDNMDAIEKDDRVGLIKRTETDDVAIRLRNLQVNLSDGTVVVDDADIDVKPGEKILLAGESGSGKSTLVRAIAGLWPWGSGEIALKRDAKLFMMPQRPYIPIGTLRRAAAYPESPDSLEEKDLHEALEFVGLAHAAERLDEEDVVWSNVLSGGEQQRLSFARLLLHKPDIVVMDESTSALDTKSQNELLTRLNERMPDMALISVGHRAELEMFHDRKVNLVRKRGGAQLEDEDKADDMPIARGIDMLRKLWQRAEKAQSKAEKKPEPSGAK